MPKWRGGRGFLDPSVITLHGRSNWLAGGVVTFHGCDFLGASSLLRLGVPCPVGGDEAVDSEGRRLDRAIVHRCGGDSYLSCAACTYRSGEDPESIDLRGEEVDCSYGRPGGSLRTVA